MKQQTSRLAPRVEFYLVCTIPSSPPNWAMPDVLRVEKNQPVEETKGEAERLVFL